jgi:SAM-dependent methyltransferase
MAERIPRAVIDTPQPNDRIYEQNITVAGRLEPPASVPEQASIRLSCGDILLGQTRHLVPRPDLSLGFRLLGRFPENIQEERDEVLSLTLARPGDGQGRLVAQVEVRLVPSQLARRAYGEVLMPTQSRLLHRENIYGSGPPLEDPGPEMLRLILEYLPARTSVLDVGCGAGAYGPPLRAAAHRWMGLELNPLCCSILDRRQLPYRKMESAVSAFPFQLGEFESAICIEVLEHVAEPDRFLAEIARVVQRRALFSVPNIEVIPYFHGREVVPWHLLEADHKNFFTRASLYSLLRKYFRCVEVFSCGIHPVRSGEEVPLHVHLFALAEK